MIVHESSPVGNIDNNQSQDFFTGGEDVCDDTFSLLLGVLNYFKYEFEDEPINQKQVFENMSLPYATPQSKIILTSYLKHQHV